MVSNQCYLLQIFLSTIIATTYQQEQFIAPLANFRVSEKEAYENVAPVLLRFPLPQQPPNLFVTNLTTCAESSPAVHCPLQYNIQNVRDLLRPLISIDSLQNSNLPPLDPFHISDCEKLDKHFTSQHVSVIQMQNYVSQLNRCISYGLVEKTNNSFATTDFITQYRQAHQRYSTRYYQNAAELIFQAAHAVENALLTTTGFLHFLSESLFWKESISLCNMRKIPRNLVKETSLLQVLTELEQRISVTGFTFVIPKENLNSYYNIPLADCAFVEATPGNLQELVVRMLVPITSSTNWHVNTIQSISFSHIFQNEQYLCLHAANEKVSTILYNNETGVELLSPDCENDFCHISASMRQRRKSCSQKILSSASEIDVTKYCPLECEKVEWFNLPVVIAENGGQFYVTGTPEFNVSCEGVIDRKFNPPTEGSLQIILPCQCSMLIDGVIYRPSPGDCQTLPISNQIVIPFNFRQFKNMIFKN